MTTTWTITPGSTTIGLDGQRRGAVTFTVTNRGDQPDRAVVDLVTDDPATRPWFTLAEPQRPVAPGATVTYQVDVAVPTVAAPGPRSFAARVYSADTAPEESSTLSDRVAFEVAPPPRRARRPWWPIAVIGTLVVLVLGVVGVLVFGGDDEPPAQPTVPNLVGRTLDEARADLRAVRLELGAQRHRQQPADAGRVLEQTVATGEPLPEGTTVDVVVGVDLAPPAPRDPPAGAALPLAPRFPPLTWTAVAGAGGYEVVVQSRICSFVGGFCQPRPPVVVTVQGGDTTTVIPPVPLGNSFVQEVQVTWQVRAIDDFGVRGPAATSAFTLR